MNLMPSYQFRRIGLHGAWNVTTVIVVILQQMSQMQENNLFYFK